MVFPIVGGNQSTGDFVTNSLRFNDDDSAYLTSGTLSSPNTDKFTVSFWVKISGARANIFSIGKRLTGETGDYYALTVDLGSGTGSGRLSLGGYNGVADSNTIAVNTDTTTGPLFRDPSAWQHHVYAFDTGQGTAGNRLKWYLNGVLQSGYNTTTTPSQNVDLFDSSGTAFRIGRMYNDESRYMDGYLAEFYYVDGQQYDHTYFGETNDNGVWVPVENGKGAGGAITFGTNGFYLQFKETGTSANASGMGADTSGNGNHLTPTNLAALDVVTDTPQNNFAVINPLHRRLTNNDPAYSEGNLKLTGQTGDGQNNNAIATIQHLKSGKWYFECKATLAANGNFGVGISDNPVGTNGNAASDSNHVWYNKDGTINYGTSSSGSYGNSYTNGDIIGIAFDLDNGAIYFYKNGTIQNSGTAARTDLLTTMAEGYTPIGFNNKGVSEFNFGNPSFSISSGNSDANGHGNFEYAVPSGYFAVNTKNLAEYG